MEWWEFLLEVDGKGRIEEVGHDQTVDEQDADLVRESVYRAQDFINGAHLIPRAVLAEPPEGISHFFDTHIPFPPWLGCPVLPGIMFSRRPTLLTIGRAIRMRRVVPLSHSTRANMRAARGRGGR